MSWFFGGIAFLILGYLTYGKLIERILGPDNRKTPCIANPDGVDYVPLPKWKNLLIQLLNIAGVGPVIGVILGIKFGKIALLIIPVGCVLMGSVHDFTAGFLSMRRNGANLPKLVKEFLGKGYARVFSWVLVMLLMLVVAVFINVPANLIDKVWFPDGNYFWLIVGIIFAYYIVATLFPVDKIIGFVYPIFGALLVIGSVALAVALAVAGFAKPEILNDCANFAAFKTANPLFPCLFVTIACGIISGFHATQIPIVSRTITSEREARSTFYGMMIAEGVIAMIWASAGLAIYNLAPENLNFAGATVLRNIAQHFLGPWVGGVTVAAVVILAITSGDTALRGARLALAEMCRVNQVPIIHRVLTCLPLCLVAAGILAWSNQSPKTFNNLWNYFAWSNQFIAVTMLLVATVWLRREKRGLLALVTAIPACFMASVVVSFILWTSSLNGQPWGLVWKFDNGSLVNCGLPLVPSIIVGVIVAITVVSFVWWLGGKWTKEEGK